MPSHDRRSFLQGAAYGGIALGASCAGLIYPGQASASDNTFKWASLTPGFTPFLTDYMVATGIDKKFGLNVGKPTSYTSVSTYYNDFVAGNYDICIGSWDTFAARYLAGVPLMFVCGITTASMIALVAPGDGVKDIRALQGKLISAPQSTGTYRMTRAVVKQLESFDIEQSAQIQNVDNPAASVSMVMARRAEAALTWEPNISAGVIRMPDIKVLYNIGDQYRRKLGVELPYFGVAIRKEALKKDPQIARRVDQAFGAAVSAIVADPATAVRVAGSGSGVPVDVLQLCIQAKRLQFMHISMSDQSGQKVMRVAGDFLTKGGLLPKSLDSGFFAF